jgi:hypothetical protein
VTGSLDQDVQGFYAAKQVVISPGAQDFGNLDRAKVSVVEPNLHKHRAASRPIWKHFRLEHAGQTVDHLIPALATLVAHLTEMTTELEIYFQKR